MSFLIDFTIEVDTENEREARRVAYVLFELLLDEERVRGIAQSPPRPGTVDEDVTDA